MRYYNEKERLNKINKELVKCIINSKKKSLSITAIGNSISNGFSLSNPGEPLLYRNKDLITCGKDNNLNIEIYQLSRSENNNSFNVFDWIINNYSEEDSFKWSINDYKRNNIKVNDIFKNGSNKKIQDIIFNNAKDKVNIVILNLGTGSVLDTITRHGNNLFSSIKREINGIMAILELIQNNNRYKETNTQVYLCGIPKISFISDIFINTKLKKISFLFANVVYVPNFKKKLFYLKDNKYIKDLHYDNNEYYHLLRVIENSIINNYLIKDLMITLDNKLYKLSNDNDLNKANHSKEEVLKVISDIAKEYKNNHGNYNYFINYIKKRYPYDFFYSFKENNLYKELNKWR